MLDAWREYVQIVSTYGSLVDVSAEQRKAETLGKEKAVRDAAKRERSDFEEQSQLTAEISAALSKSRAAGQPDSDIGAELEDRVATLEKPRKQAAPKPKPKSDEA